MFPLAHLLGLSDEIDWIETSHCQHQTSGRVFYFFLSLLYGKNKRKLINNCIGSHTKCFMSLLLLAKIFSDYDKWGWKSSKDINIYKVNKVYYHWFVTKLLIIYQICSTLLCLHISCNQCQSALLIICIDNWSMYHVWCYREYN